MKCPVCDLDMVPGYLSCGAALWSEKKHNRLVPSQKEKYALYLQMPILSPHHIESCCCPKCKRIIVNGGEYPSNLIWVDKSAKLPD